MAFVTKGWLFNQALYNHTLFINVNIILVKILRKSSCKLYQSKTCTTCVYLTKILIHLNGDNSSHTQHESLYCSGVTRLARRPMRIRQIIILLSYYFISHKNNIQKQSTFVQTFFVYEMIINNIYFYNDSFINTRNMQGFAQK